MMNDKMKKHRAFDQLGLPPMTLAETSVKERKYIKAQKCFSQAIQRLFFLLFIVVFGIGTYILLIKLFENTVMSHLNHNTDVIIFSDGDVTSNRTLHENYIHIIFEIENITESGTRNKRSTLSHFENHNSDILKNLDDYNLGKVREIILKHKLLCQNSAEKDLCKGYVAKLKSILENGSDVDNQITSKHNLQLTTDNVKSDSHVKTNIANVSKRDANVIAKDLSGVAPMESRENYQYGYPPANMPQAGASAQLADTCLLARLLKHNYPHVHGIYDAPTAEYLSPINDLSPARYLSPAIPPYVQSRNIIETRRRKIHPQDVDIFMSFHTTKQAPLKTENPLKSSIRDAECGPGFVSCRNGGGCVSEEQWCDGNVDCEDVSDEMQCNCKSRVDKARLCDGYFDCPFGEDEMGCFGCEDNTFSCDEGLSTRVTCFTKEQRCNNVVDCPNHKDEVECNMLAPSLHKKPLFAISNTEGFLHRNFKGDWYAVCHNPYMWAHDACRRETGLIIRPPFIQMVPIDPLLKVNYLNAGPGGLIHTSETCLNSSAVYVTCPDFLCGTRVQTTLQLLRENPAVESHLFGRNKRFLLNSHPFPFMFYGNRGKRDTYSSGVHNGIDKSIKQKRAESRVVGGKLSRPAAWPWMVAMYRNGMFHCGGVILTQNWVISAAHCVHKFWDHYFEIQVGMLRRFSFSPQEQNLKVTHIIVNQRYNQTDMTNDLSLLRVEPAIQFSRWVRPICLPGANTAGPNWFNGPSPGTMCTAIGWGATIEHGPDPDHMREVELPIWDKCKHREDRAGKEICAGPVEGGKDACQGDSGGPLLCRNPLNSQQWYLAGIVSHGDGCARRDNPGVYTRVSLYVKWIKFHISSKNLPFIQPLQECPGFKCKSGITKCLPSKRKCDKTIDCLGGEDELNCETMRTAEILSDDILPTKNKRKLEVLQQSESSLLNPTQTTMITTTNLGNADITQIEDIITTPSSTMQITFDDLNLENNLSSTPSAPMFIGHEGATSEISKTSIPDFEHASTLELSIPTTSEILDNSFEAQVTGDPNISTMSEESSETFPRDMQTKAVEFRGDSLQIESSIKEDMKITTDNENKNNKLRRMDIPEDMNSTNVDGTISTTMHSIEKNTEQLGFEHNTEKNNLGDIFETTTIGKKDLIPNNQKLTTIGAIEIAKNNTIENKSEELIIKLLPDITNITENKNISLANNEDSANNQSFSQHTKTENSMKNLPELEKSDLEVFSEPHPATIRRKHRNPKDFECRRITQLIPHHQRCDHKADCEDGTDELGCTCIDYLSTFDEKLICDGMFDCADGHDEIECFSCPENYFFCKQSQNCIPMTNVCDGKPQCPQGEDELDCFALTNGENMIYEIDEKPKLNIEGFLTKKNKNSWHVICEDSLTVEQQNQAATHICHYLGFSAANEYSIKYINVKNVNTSEFNIENNSRTKRETKDGIPVHFEYKELSDKNERARSIIIKEPQFIQEQCIPNITKTCKSLYVYCERSLFTDFENQEVFFNRAADDKSLAQKWPWIAKIYVDGEYRCTGVLVDISWVLVSDSCLWDSLLTRNYITVILGAHQTLKSTKGVYEKVHNIDMMRAIPSSRVLLLHMKQQAKYSNMVKPMIVPFINYYNSRNNACVAIGQDNNNKTISVFVEETINECKAHNRCFRRKTENNICSSGSESLKPWAGIISCHNEKGWYPAASFVDSRGECRIGANIVGTDIQNIRYEIKYHSANITASNGKSKEEDIGLCATVRCSRGKCVDLSHMCDGVRQCEDGNDEAEVACLKKKIMCTEDPHQTGCECSLGQMKCRNGKCISKELFKDGNDDCGDQTDEPRQSICSDYLARVMPSRLCDGILHCHDRSDEDPMFCKCFAKRNYKCGSRTKEVEHCVAPDMVCDGIRDCPNGEDEKTCIGLNAPQGTPYGTGLVIVRSHGVWHSKCYPSKTHTKTELEAICQELGFISGHAKEIELKEHFALTHNNLFLDPFSQVTLNNQTILKIRNTDEPLARAVVDEKLTDCFPVVIECL